ncbi:RNA-directed DNA polymerase [Chitinophaga sedimenti]|uniref:RNA-directed DNA polymerase n=1 Tax=Chitinophaga sedimenti TaxID=2033606 RepID=UPI00200652D0|nr:RNA-directed DNA polymerase [Chitinophaga sedimenti]MCK7557568.1 RNA-directed DNA polymerase [Chitinophaga sedimenti]
MPNLFEQFLDRENFYFAFKKLNYILKQCNEWYNPIELSAYEACLASRIPELRNKIESGEYFPSPIQLLPFPKTNGSSGERIRHYFKVSLDDQLVWIALINVLGEKLESVMPDWSYGNRLYRPIWFEDGGDSGKMLRQVGSVHNTSKHLYRTWNQAWPLYRRHISMTIKAMSQGTSSQTSSFDDVKEEEIYELEKGWIKKKYLSGQYWDNDTPLERLFWIGIDFKNFFPSIHTRKIVEFFREILKDRNDVDELLELVSRLLLFQVDERGWGTENLISLKVVKSSEDLFYKGIPTGLIVAGVLANVAMYGIDKEVSKWIDANRKVAVFRYVDDHVVLGKSWEALNEFFIFYRGLLQSFGIGIEIQEEKLSPADAFREGEMDPDKKDDFSIDVEFPEPLMTQTLEKVSMLNEEDFELSTNEELEKVQVDLEQFLISNFPDSEMRKDTRMAFAAGRLAQMANFINPDFRRLDFSLPDNFQEARDLALSLLNEELKKREPSKKKQF